jgi:tetratricopeptide (TPR) repeat protein
MWKACACSPTSAPASGVQEDADFLLESAVELDPENIQFRLDYIQVLRKRQKFAAALEQAQILMDRDPDNPVFQSHYAIESMQAGDYETALDYFERVLSVLPDDPATLVSRGHALKTYGRTDDAIASYRRAAEVAPGHGDAWYGLANLKTYRFSDAELTAMEAAAASPDLDHACRVFISPSPSARPAKTARITTRHLRPMPAAMP